jgi:hypothetical protein
VWFRGDADRPLEAGAWAAAFVGDGPDAAGKVVGVATELPPAGAAALGVLVCGEAEEGAWAGATLGAPGLPEPPEVLEVLEVPTGVELPPAGGDAPPPLLAVVGVGVGLVVPTVVARTWAGVKLG